MHLIQHLILVMQIQHFLLLLFHVKSIKVVKYCKGGFYCIAVTEYMFFTEVSDDCYCS